MQKQTISGMTKKEFKETSLILFTSIIGSSWLIGKTFSGIKRFIKKLYYN